MSKFVEYLKQLDLTTQKDKIEALMTTASPQDDAPFEMLLHDDDPKETILETKAFIDDVIKSSDPNQLGVLLSDVAENFGGDPLVDHFERELPVTATKTDRYTYVFKDEVKNPLELLDAYQYIFDKIAGDTRLDLPAPVLARAAMNGINLVVRHGSDKNVDVTPLLKAKNIDPNKILELMLESWDEQAMEDMGLHPDAVDPIGSLAEVLCQDSRIDANAALQLVSSRREKLSKFICERDGCRTEEDYPYPPADLAVYDSAITQLEKALAKPGGEMEGGAESIVEKTRKHG